MPEDKSAQILIRPPFAVPGSRIDIVGPRAMFDGTSLPDVSVGGEAARVVFASPDRLGVLVPDGTAGGAQTVQVGGVDAVGAVSVGAPVASKVHQVDSPVFDRDGNLFVTYSGARGEQVPVSIFRIHPHGAREDFVTGIVNPTSMAFGPDGDLYVSSRFEGVVYRVRSDGRFAAFASDLGVACGLAFGPDGTLFVGDRSGTVFRVDRDGSAHAFAEVPASVAAFHLALGPDANLYVTAPTLNSYDRVYRIDPAGRVDVFRTGFGRPQGLAFHGGALYVAEALAGWSGVFRVAAGGEPELVVSGRGVVGLAFDPQGALAVASNDTVWRFDEGL